MESSGSQRVRQDCPFQWQSVFTTKQVQYQSAPVYLVARPVTAITLTPSNEIFMLSNSAPPPLFLNGKFLSRV